MFQTRRVDFAHASLGYQHSSRSLVFQSANAGYGIIVDLVMYGIGHKARQNPDGFPGELQSVTFRSTKSCSLSALPSSSQLGVLLDCFWVEVPFLLLESVSL